VAICIDSSAGIRGVCSARCKLTINTDVAYKTALCSVTRNRSVVGVTVSCWLFLMYLTYVLTVVQTVLHLIHPIYFKFYLSTAYPSDIKLHCIFSRCCLQYASVLQAGIIFQSINWLSYFYIPEQKGPLLVVSVITHIFTHNPEYEASAHFMHARQLLTVSCGTIARQCIIYYSVGSPSGKEMALLEMCNQLWSEICDLLGLYAAWNGNSYHHCSAWLLKMGPVGCTEMSVPNYQYMLCNIPEDWRSQCKNCTQISVHKCR